MTRLREKSALTEYLIIATLISLILSAFAIGFLSACQQEYRGAIKLIKAQRDEFAEIVKAASAANNTHAAHIMKLDSRIESLEFKNNNLSAKLAPGWK